MSRIRRPHVPGAPFHVVTRIQGHEPLLLGAEPEVIQIVRAVAARADGLLLAYAVMSNHLHLVYVQGARPLSSFFQPVFTRIALLVRRRHRVEGHVFERRFRESACLDADHLRNTLAYVHLNAVRASVCTSADEYPWSSHGEYRGAGQSILASAGTRTALQLFSPRRGASLDECVSSYCAYLAWRVAMDEFKKSKDNGGDGVAPAGAQMRGGDLYWLERFGASAMPAAERRRCPPSRPDLRDIARCILNVRAPDQSLDWLRSGGRQRPLVRLRNDVIDAALQAGHRGVDVAAFLSVSSAAVSRRQVLRLAERAIT